jgi:hypothetical protein
MNPYQAMMMAAQGRQGGGQMQAQPVHHILEEDPGTGKVVGSTLRADMEAARNQFKSKAMDPNLPIQQRQHFDALANKLEVDIGEEDAYHMSNKGNIQTLQGDDAFARLQAERNRARAGQYQQPNLGMSPEAARGKGWVPPR